MRKIKAYLSHPIMGIKKEQSTETEIAFAVIKAKRIANILRVVFPKLDIYCPAEHEEFVHKTYLTKKLSIEDILEIDCQILKECDLLLVYNYERMFSKGMKVEYKFAYENNIPSLVFGKITSAIEVIKIYLKKVK